MSNVYQLLKLNRDLLENFSLQSRDIENNIECDRVINRAIKQLKEIEEKTQLTDARPQFRQETVNEIVDKLKNAAKGLEQNWSIKELRIIAYSMLQFKNESTQFSYALTLLNENWRDLYINGLLFCLLNSWNTCPNALRNDMYTLIKNRIRVYSGPIKKYQIIKNKIDLLAQNGPVRLVALLKAKGLTIYQAPEILGYKRTAISLPYFSDAIIHYFKTEASDLLYIEELFRQHHTLDRTKKLVLANLVDEVDKSNNCHRQDAVCRMARRLLGDITVASTWAKFTGATIEEEGRLKHAQQCIVAWGARQTIEAFFDICVQDPRRRKVWLALVSQISDFRIVGSTSVKTKLQANSAVSHLLRSSFIETNSKVSTTAALVLYVKNYVFVEFSDVGALYIYQSNNRQIAGLQRKRSLDSTASLKQPTIGMAVEQINSRYYLCNDGRISHRGEWESRLALWLRNKLHIHLNL